MDFVRVFWIQILFNPGEYSILFDLNRKVKSIQPERRYIFAIVQQKLNAGSMGYHGTWKGVNTSYKLLSPMDACSKSTRD